jgi:uncharacterized delta-60 repeat protein
MKLSADQLNRWSFAHAFFAYGNRHMRLGGYVLFSTIVLTLFWQTALAGDGDLDMTFGTGGKVITNINNNDDYGETIAVQPDGKIIVAGRSGVYAGILHSALARYNSDGSLDQTFGGGGPLITSIDPEGDGISAVVVQPDGKIVAAGTLIHGPYSVGFFVMRLNADGSYDLTFNGNGRNIFTFGDNGGAATDVLLQPDGKIVVVGSSGVSTYSTLNEFALARFNSDGTFDQSFGTGGKVKTHFEGQYVTGSKAASVALQTDGKLVVGGSYKNGEVTTQFAVARYNSDGSLDTTFGSGGTVTTPLGASSYGHGNSVAIQLDGKIVLVGDFHTARHNNDFALARYNSNGSLDTTFGNGGKLVNDLFGESDDIATSLIIQPDGKLVVAGRTGQYPNFKFALVRYNSYGNFDQSFAGSGKVMTDFGTTTSESDGAALQPDGKIVLAGYTITGTTGENFNSQFAVARYLTAVPHTARFDFDGDLKADVSVFRNGVWHLNRSTAGYSAFQFGFNSDQIVPADFDGDGKTDIAVFRPNEGNWYWFNSGSSTYSIVHFGANGDVPVPADYDGDLRADYAVYRSGVWYIQRSSAGLLITQFGLAADKPVPADYDGDGKYDIAVYRDGTWYVQRTAAGLLITQFGLSADKPLAADYDGDGKSDIAVWRPSEGVWYITQSSNGAIRTFAWGVSSDTPATGDYDGDGKTDLAFYRGSGEWWIWQSQTNNYSVQLFGIAGDMPVPSAYVR